jgi:hypothetical protein
VKPSSLKYYVALALIAVVLMPAILLLMFWQIIPLTSRLPDYMTVLVMVLPLSIFAVVIGYLVLRVVIPLSGEKVDPRTISFRYWFFGWVFVLEIGCGIAFFSFVFDTRFPSMDSDIRSTLSPLIVLLILLVLASPPLRSKTRRFLARLFGTEDYLEQKIIWNKETEKTKRE